MTSADLGAGAAGGKGRRRAAAGTSLDPALAQAIRQYPSVSLLLPVAGAEDPWRDRLRRLRAVAEARLREEFGAGIDTALLGRLDEAVENAKLVPDAASLALFVNASGAWSAPLGVRVRERVVIDDTFATRDLVHAANRSPGYWLLALALDRPRLLRGQGQHLHPERFAPATPVGPTRDGRDRRGRDRSDVVESQRTRKLRAIDTAVGERIGNDQHPLIVVGAEPSLSHYLRITRHAARIEAPVRQAPDHDLAALAERVWPTVTQVLADRRDEALASLDRAVSTRRSVSGPTAVWRAARRTTGALLLVEHGFEYPARLLVDGTLQPSDDPTAPGVVDDAVDDLIEIVLGRRGRVEIVPDGTLGAHQRVALVCADGTPR